MVVRPARARLAGMAAAAALALAACSVPLTPTDSRAGAVETGAAHTPQSQASASAGANATEAVPWSDLEVLADPHAYAGPSTATIADPSVTALDPALEPDLPVTVVSHERDGERDVAVSDTSRVVVMDISGSIAATAWALGRVDQVVRSSAARVWAGDATGDL